MSEWKVHDICERRESLSPETEMDMAVELPTPRQIYQALKNVYADIIFVRVGDDFLCFDDDAEKLARVCGLQPARSVISFPMENLAEYKAKLLTVGYNILEAELD